MILGEADHTASGVTLDALFRRAGVRNAHARALIDPPNRASFTDGAPRMLTYAQADRAISALAATLRGLGLHTDTVVGLQLPNTVESVVAFLGVLRAGMIAAPLPLLWRQQDMVEALGRAGAKAIVTAGRIGACAHAEVAMEAAAELFPIRQICAFGDNLPDGVVPLDGIFASAAGEAPPLRIGDAAAHVAAMTFDVGPHGAVAVAHDHAQLVAAGDSLVRACGLGIDAPILSTIPLGSFAGLAVTLLPWLIAGGALHLHHGFDAPTFATQRAVLEGGAVVLPGPALAALGGRVGPSNTTVALWRAPLALAAEMAVANVVDVVCRREAALVAVARTADGLPDPAVIDAAAMSEAPGFIAVGGYKFSLAALDAATAAIDPAAMITALPDAVLGQRLAGHAVDAPRVREALVAHGFNPLVAAAFRARSHPLPSP